MCRVRNLVHSHTVVTTYLSEMGLQIDQVIPSLETIDPSLGEIINMEEAVEEAIGLVRVLEEVMVETMIMMTPVIMCIPKGLNLVVQDITTLMKETLMDHQETLMDHPETLMEVLTQEEANVGPTHLTLTMNINLIECFYNIVLLLNCIKNATYGRTVSVWNLNVRHQSFKS